MNTFLACLRSIVNVIRQFFTPYRVNPVLSDALGKYYLGVVNDPGEPNVGEGPFAYPVVVKNKPIGTKQPAAFVFSNQHIGNNGPWWITPKKKECTVDMIPGSFQDSLVKSLPKMTIDGINQAIKNLDRPEKSIPCNL